MYKVILKDGRTILASKVETSPGFVQLECWACERRLPAGEVAEIRTAGLGDKRTYGLFLLGVFFVAFLIALIFLPG